MYFRLLEKFHVLAPSRIQDRVGSYIEAYKSGVKRPKTCNETYTCDKPKFMMAQADTQYNLLWYGSLYFTTKELHETWWFEAHNFVVNDVWPSSQSDVERGQRSRMKCQVVSTGHHFICHSVCVMHVKYYTETVIGFRNCSHLGII